MGILRRLREWREDKDGTLIGPDIEADSLKADDVDIDGLSEGDVIGYLTALDSGDRGGEIRTQTTNDVSTSPTAIWQSQTTGELGSGALLVVYGDRQGDFQNFTDIVHYHREDSPAVVNQINNSAATRTYSRNGDELQLAMGSDTYNVSATALNARGET